MVVRSDITVIISTYVHKKVEYLDNQNNEYSDNQNNDYSDN